MSNTLGFQITKNDTTFMVSSKCRAWFMNCIDNNASRKWENPVFKMIDKYQNINGDFLDIGCWNGVFSLYASNKFSKVIAIECDPKALVKIHNNILLSDFNNISVLPIALSDTDEIRDFGGDRMGNSMSSLFPKNVNKIIKIQTTNINSTNINFNKLSLVKMDIEGAEILVIPTLLNNKTFMLNLPPLLLSLHWYSEKNYNFPKDYDIIEVVAKLNIVYHTIINVTNRKVVSITDILDNELSNLLFIK